MIRERIKRELSVKKKLLFILNDPVFFISHRLPIALEAQKEGYEIHVATGVHPPPKRIIDEGFIYHPIPLSRSGRHIFSECISLLAMYRLMKRLTPDMVHLVTVKPVIYGSFAARLARVPAVVAAISGLGYAFTNNHFKARCLRQFIMKLYKHVFRHKNIHVIFQNNDDKNTLLSIGVLKKNQTTLIRGSGVDLTQYYHTHEPTSSPLIVMMAARLIRDKGVFEYIEAVKILKQQGIQARFWLAGLPDPGNPTSIDEKQLQTWIDNNDIEYKGYCQDIPLLLSQVNVVVLPSYREGLPRFLAEAAACGRATVTTDVPGCREAIIPNKTGLLANVRDSKSLADTINILLTDHSLRNSMGTEGRRLAEQEFNISKIVDAHLQIYRRVSEHVV